MPPTEYVVAERLDEKIGTDAAVPAVAVHEWMDKDETIVESNCKFVRLISLMLHPCNNVIQGIPNVGGDVGWG